MRQFSIKHVDRRDRLCAKNVLGAGYVQKMSLEQTMCKKCAGIRSGAKNVLGSDLALKMCWDLVKTMLGSDCRKFAADTLHSETDVESPARSCVYVII